MRGDKLSCLDQATVDKFFRIAHLPAAVLPWLGVFGVLGASSPTATVNMQIETMSGLKSFTPKSCWFTGV